MDISSPMKKKKTYVNNRREEILELINENGSALVEDLAERFGVSNMTIRRDLEWLEMEDEIVRVYGGAVKHKRYSSRDHQMNAKEFTARFAATLVEDNDTIFINSSTTALAVLKYVTKKNITVITNNTRIMELDWDDSFKVILTGGEIRTERDAMVGEMVIKNISDVMASKSFIGCSGFTTKMGVTTRDFNQVAVNRTMFDNTMGEAYIICDSSKIGVNSNFTSIPTSAVTTVITDKGISEADKKSLEAKNIRVLVAHLV